MPRLRGPGLWLGVLLAVLALVAAAYSSGAAARDGAATTSGAAATDGEAATSGAAATDWTVTPTFKVVADPADPTMVFEMRGFEGRFGFIDAPLVAGQQQKIMWHFWGRSEDLVGKSLKVVAVHERTGKTLTALETRLAGPNNGAAAHTPSGMTLPAPGLWRLDVYVDGRLQGHIVVEVLPG